MKAYRKTATAVGVLFILATVLSLVSSALIGSVIGAQNYLADASANGNQLIVGALFDLAAGIAVVLIPAALFPALRQQQEGMALGYFGFRIIEAITLIIGAMSALLLLSLGQKYVAAGAPAASSFQTLGALVLAVHDWAFPLNPVVFGPGALLFNSVLYQTRLVPRWLSAWGIVGAIMVFALGLLGMFGTRLTYLAIPIGVQEMVFALWLIAKRFNPSPAALEQAHSRGKVAAAV